MMLVGCVFHSSKDDAWMCVFYSRTDLLDDPPCVCVCWEGGRRVKEVSWERGAKG